MNLQVTVGSILVSSNGMTPATVPSTDTGTVNNVLVATIVPQAADRNPIIAAKPVKLLNGIASGPVFQSFDADGNVSPWNGLLFSGQNVLAGSTLEISITSHVDNGTMGKFLTALAKLALQLAPSALSGVFGTIASWGAGQLNSALDGSSNGHVIASAKYVIGPLGNETLNLTTPSDVAVSYFQRNATGAVILDPGGAPTIQTVFIPKGTANGQVALTQTDLAAASSGAGR